MLLWLLSSCGLLLCAYAALWIHWRRSRHLLSGLPTYQKLPFVGNLHKLYGDGRLLFQRLEEISGVMEKTKLPFVVWLGPCPVLVTYDPDDVRAITNAFVEKPYYYSMGRVWLGDGLVLAPGSIWKHNIKKLAGTFTISVVDDYQSVFNVQAHKLVQKLKSEVEHQPFDIMHDLANTTLEAICQTALGVSDISESIVTSDYYQAFNRTLELFISRGLNLFLHPDFIYRLTPSYRELKRCIAVIHNVSETAINKRMLERDVMKKHNIVHADKSVLFPMSRTENNQTKFKTYLDILMELSETDPTLTEMQIKSEVDTIILGGQETVASTLFYAFLMIGCHKDVQDKLNAELKEIFCGSTRVIKKEDLNRMQYCEAIINETLRLYPPVPIVMRYSDQELQLKSCRIPVGTACGINIWGAGRSRHTWGPDALQYRPERWLQGIQPPANPGAFLAFSYGRRACIDIFWYVPPLGTYYPIMSERQQSPHTLLHCWLMGFTHAFELLVLRPAGFLTMFPSPFRVVNYLRKKYAMPIMKTVLAYCVRELEFLSEADNMEMKLDIALRPISGHLIQVRLREQ